MWILLSIFSLAASAPEGDLVKNLPLTQDFPLNFSIYSGYLPLNNTNGKSLHYYFVTSEKDKAKDPLILWLNGGPGCSSLEGAFMENGPFYFDEAKMIMHQNPYAWNKLASMLYIEAPAGVGFSILGEPSNSHTNDNITADNNMLALQLWFEKFPEFKPNDFYIMGESYAGIYVPMLAARVLEFPAIKLKGFAVGNGVVDWSVDAMSAWPSFLWAHGLYDYSTHIQWTSNGCTWSSTEKVCLDALNTMNRLFTDVNYYDVYRPCVYPGLENSHHKARWLGKTALKGVVNCVPDLGLISYMNVPEVRTALKIPSSVPPWQECVDLDYEIFYNLGSFYLYPQLVKSGLRILIYSGDTDSAVPTSGTKQWIHKLSMQRTSAWQQWSLNKQVAGFYEIYQQNFTFMTIKGSGHMCIQWKRPEGFELLKSFLRGVPPSTN